MKLKDRFLRFMRDRYGVDEFSRFLLWMVIIFWFIAILFRMAGRDGSHALTALGRICDYISLAAIIYCWFRTFSKKIEKRQKENQLYLKYRQKLKSRPKTGNPDKAHKIFKCPKCGQKIRVPKNKGKIAITCPNCGNEFIKKT